MTDDTTTVRPAWLSVAAPATTTIIRIKHAATPATPKRRRAGVLTAVIAGTVAIALTSLGFLVPNGHQAPLAVPNVAAAAADQGQGIGANSSLDNVVDDSATLAPAASAASGAIDADATVKAEIAAASQVAQDAGTVAQAKAQADYAAAHGSSGRSAVDYGSGENAGTPVAVPNGAFIFPVQGFVITSPFGWRIHPVYHVESFHTGVDLAVHCGTPIVASGDGVVTFAGWAGALGNYVEIDHGDLSTGYGHQSQIVATLGQQVKQGDLIGYVGATGTATGCHVHFQAINGQGQYFDATTLIH